MEGELENGDNYNEYTDVIEQEETTIEQDLQNGDEIEEPEEMVISIEGEKEEESENNLLIANNGSGLVKDLRKLVRDGNKRIKHLEEQLTKTTAPVQVNNINTKPTLESCDYDDDVYSQKLEDWHKQKIAKELEEAKAKQEWEQRISVYTQAKQSLKVSDFDDAEDVVKETLSEQQQGILLHGADDPAMLVYALGKYPQKAKELAGIHDPVKYAFAVAKLETKLKTTTIKKTAPAPEKMAPNNGGISKSPDGIAAKLEAEAARTGDYSKLFAYNRSKRNQK